MVVPGYFCEGTWNPSFRRNCAWKLGLHLKAIFGEELFLGTFHDSSWIFLWGNLKSIFAEELCFGALKDSSLEIFSGIFPGYEKDWELCGGRYNFQGHFLEISRLVGGTSKIWQRLGTDTFSLSGVTLKSHLQRGPVPGNFLWLFLDIFVGKLEIHLCRGTVLGNFEG